MTNAALPSSTRPSRVKGERPIDVIIRMAKRDFPKEWQRICNLARLFEKGTGEEAARERIGVRYEYHLTLETPHGRELYELSSMIDRLVEHFIAVELDHYALFGFIGPQKFEIEGTIKPRMLKLRSNRLEIDKQTIYTRIYLIEVQSEANDVAKPVQAEIVNWPLRPKQARKKPARSRGVKEHDRQAAVSDCIKYLENVFKDSPDRRSQTNVMLLKACHEKFKVTSRGYRDARLKALNLVPEAKKAWTKGGH